MIHHLVGRHQHQLLHAQFLRLEREDLAFLHLVEELHRAHRCPGNRYAVTVSQKQIVEELLLRQQTGAWF